MKTRYTFIDLFAGCGGLSEGFYKKDFKALVHVDNDPFSCDSLRMRMKKYSYKEKNISVLHKNITDKDIIKKINNQLKGSKIDVLLGGPPCQSFSSLGRAKDENSMKYDKRNYLFESYEKILNYFKPKIFLFENVTGLLTTKLKGKKIINTIKHKLGKNYKISKKIDKMILNSCEYGVPQMRKRVFLIGIRKDISFNIEKIFTYLKKSHYTPICSKKERRNKKKYLTVRDAIADLPALKPGQGKKMTNLVIKKRNNYLKKIRSKKNSELFDHVARTHNNIDIKRFREMSKNKWTFEELLKKKPSLRHKKQRVFKNSYVVQHWDKPARTIISHLYKDGNQFIHPDYRQGRTLTVREAARLQSFPDDFYFAGSRTQQYKQIGNAVPPLMAESIANSIKKVLKEISSA